VISAKLHKHQHELLLAACDAELLGKTLKKGSVEFHVSERFYGGEAVDEKKLLEMLSHCTMANLVGERVIKLAKEKGLIRETGVLSVGGVPHAQILRMR
jgi:hypothetical protein